MSTEQNNAMPINTTVIILQAHIMTTCIPRYEKIKVTSLPL
jgi:hypothetical protein